MTPYTLLFLSSGSISIPLLKTLLLDDRCKIIGLICQPDRPAGRNKVLASPETKAIAEAFGIPVYQPERLSQDETLLKSFQKNPPDFLLTFAYGQILNQNWLDLAKVAPLNVHASLLPKYRGASPIQTALLHGDEETGLTLMKMVRAMDAGPIYSQKKLPIQEEWTAEDLEDALGEEAALFIPDELARMFGEKKMNFQEQNLEEVSFCGLLNKDSGFLDFQDNDQTILNRFRAFNPWPGLWTFYEKKRLKLLELESSNFVFSPGEIHVENGSIFVGTKGKALKMNKLQLEGKTALNAADFLRGFPNFGGVLGRSVES